MSVPGLSQLPYTRLAGWFLSLLLSAWVWFIVGRSSRAWASVWWWLFLSLEKRKETTIGVFTWCEVLARPRPQCFWEVSSGHWLLQAPHSSGVCLRRCKLIWDNSHAKVWMSPFTPLAAFPKCSIAVQVPQKGETFKRDGFTLKTKIPCKCFLPRMWLCLLAVC